jgi:SAM-dependent methyltransferase
MLRSVSARFCFAALTTFAFSACNRSEPVTASPGITPQQTMTPASRPAPLEPATKPVAAPPAEQATPTADIQAAQGSEARAPEEATPKRTPDVVYIPTPQPLVDKMLSLAKVKKTDLVYDLGCGDGRIVVTAAKKYGAHAIGFDIDPKRIAEAKQNVAKNGVEDLVTIEQKDIFTLDLSPANVVTLYLLPELNVKLIPQLEQLAPGSRIVSHDFDMEGVEPVKHLSMRPTPSAREHEIYLWIAPINKKQ